MLLSRLLAAGKLERVARGVYSLPGRALSEHRSLAEVALRVPRGVECLLSALRVHGIGTQAPLEVWMAIPHHSPTPRLDQPALRVVRMSGGGAGRWHRASPDRRRGCPRVQRGQDGGRLLQVPQQGRPGRCTEALHDGWSQHKLAMDALWHHARVDRVANVMRPYLESVAA